MRVISNLFTGTFYFTVPNKDYDRRINRYDENYTRKIAEYYINQLYLNRNPNGTQSNNYINLTKGNLAVFKFNKPFVMGDK